MEGKGGIGGSALPGIGERRESRVRASCRGGSRWATSMDFVMGGDETWGAGSVGEERRHGLLGSSGGVCGTAAHQPVADSLDGWRQWLVDRRKTMTHYRPVLDRRGRAGQRPDGPHRLGGTNEARPV
jgi:hypothetical protein